MQKEENQAFAGSKLKQSLQPSSKKKFFKKIMIFFAQQQSSQQSWCLYLNEQLQSDRYNVHFPSLQASQRPLRCFQFPFLLAKSQTCFQDPVIRPTSLLFLMIIIFMMQQEEVQAFIGSKLKSIPHSSLIYATSSQLLLHSKRQLIRLDLPTQTLVHSNSDDEKLIHTTYHPTLQLYLILTERHIIAINSQGQLIKRMDNDSIFAAKYFFIMALDDGYQGKPNSRSDFAVYVKGDHLYSCPLDVYFERQMIKNKGICDVGLNFQKPELHQSPQYIQNAKYLHNEGLLILWNSHETYVYTVPKLNHQRLKRLYIYNKISRRENLSLDYAVSLPLKLMAVGYQSGAVKIFQLDDSRKYVQELRGHQSSCLTVLVPFKAQNFLYSGSSDSSVRIWNLQDFQQVYALQLDLLVNSIIFITQKILHVTTTEGHGRSYLCQLNTDLLQPVVNENRGGQLIGLKCDGQWCISVYSNNFVEFFSAVNRQRDLANEKIEYPQKYGSVRDVFPLETDLYAIALEKGFSLVRFNKRQVSSENFELKKLVYNESIAKAREQDGFIQLIHEKLLGTYLFNVLLDWKEIPVSIKVTYVYFHRSNWLPKWDGTSQSKTTTKATTTTYCILGTNKGEIFFVDIQHRTHYYTKVYFHTSQIMFIREIATSIREESFFLSMSHDRQIVVWRLSHQEPPVALITLGFARQFTYKDLFRNYLVLGEKTGELNIIEILPGSHSISFRKSMSVAGHIRAIICGDYLNTKPQSLFLTGGQDSVIKIWQGVQKKLIFQIKLFGIISAVSFTHHHINLIVCHNEQISILKDQKLKSLKRAMNSIDEEREEGESHVEEIDARQFFSKAHQGNFGNRNPRLHRLGSKYTNLFHKMSVREDFAEQPLEFIEPKLQTMTSLPPQISFKESSSQRLESLQKLAPRTKRFHILNSSADSEVSLPRINTKNSTYDKILPSPVKKDHPFLELKPKKKSYSMAGKNQ